MHQQPFLQQHYPSLSSLALSPALLKHTHRSFCCHQRAKRHIVVAGGPNSKQFVLQSSDKLAVLTTYVSVPTQNPSTSNFASTWSKPTRTMPPRESFWKMKLCVQFAQNDHFQHTLSTSLTFISARGYFNPHCLSQWLPKRADILLSFNELTNWHPLVNSDLNASLCSQPCAHPVSLFINLYDWAPVFIDTIACMKSVIDGTLWRWHVLSLLATSPFLSWLSLTLHSFIFPSLMPFQHTNACIHRSHNCSYFHHYTIDWTLRYEACVQH